MSYGFYLNGVFSSVLEEIVSAQAEDPDRICYLQPYHSSAILRFRESPPTSLRPIPIYMSTTRSLNEVAYVGEVVGWDQKGSIPDQILAEMNAHIAKWQPREEEIYSHANGSPCANLIHIRRLVKLARPIPNSQLIKESDGMPLGERTQSGNWSYVDVEPRLTTDASLPIHSADEVRTELERGVEDCLNMPDDVLAARLARTEGPAERIQILSQGFRRRPGVVAAVLRRAKGTCESCAQPAPFVRASDDTPYLEVHHKDMLSNGGADTLENAIAVCPNCHRKLHYGKPD